MKRAAASTADHASHGQRGRGRRGRAQDMDRHVGARLRERRLLLGLTLQQVGELVGITYQQAQKYEIGANRMTASRLYQMAQALGVQPGYFCEGLEAGVQSAAVLSRSQRQLQDLTQSFLRLLPWQREMVADLARVLAAEDPASPAEPRRADEAA
jgi:transcriptional regulator with XRE-family HTH domain